MRSTPGSLAAAALALALLAGSGAARPEEQKAPPAKAAPSAGATAERAQTRKVELPAPIRTAFEAAYPKAVIRSVSTEKAGHELHYEVESTEGTTARDLIYRPDGTLVEMEEKIAQTDLPRPVQDALAAKYGNGRVLKAERLTRGALVLYEIRLRYKDKTREVTFDADGTKVAKAKARKRTPTKHH